MSERWKRRIARCARLRQKRNDAVPHLLRGLVRKRDRENRLRRYPVRSHKMGNAMRDHARLAAARAGKDQQRAIDVRCRFVLLGV